MGDSGVEANGEDRELLRRAYAGNGEALRALFERTTPASSGCINTLGREVLVLKHFVL